MEQKNVIIRCVRIPAEVDKALADAKKQRPHMTFNALIVEAIAERFAEKSLNH
jgi:hypothetical protein